MSCLEMWTYQEVGQKTFSPELHPPLVECSCLGGLTRKAFAVVLTLSSSRFSRYVQQAEGQCQHSVSASGAA